MKKLTHMFGVLGMVACLANPPVQAAGMDPIFLDALPQGTDSALSLKGYFLPRADDVGKPISIFVVAILPHAGAPAYAKTPAGWLAIDLARPGTLLTLANHVAAGLSHTIELLPTMDIRTLYGTAIYVGYGVEGTSDDAALLDMLQHTKYRLIHTLKPSVSMSGPPNLAACPADIATPLFSTIPVDLDHFIAFRPLGFMSTPIHMFPAKHSAFSMTAVGQAAVPRPVKAPSTATVTEIYEASFSTGGKNYQVFMHPCRELRIYFGHLVTVSEKLRTAFAQGTPQCNSFNDGSATVTTCRRENLSVALEEGETFGTGPDSAGVDFGTLDFRRDPAGFIYRAHYDAFYPFYTSPLDYFAPGVKQAFQTKFGSVFGANMRTIEPVGGSYMQDLAGTAQGNWFLPGKYHSNTTDLSGFLGLAHDYVDPGQTIIAAGPTIKGMRLGLYSYKVETSGLINRDFSEVKVDGNIYCLDGFIEGRSAGEVPVSKPNGVLLLSLLNEVTLKAELIEASSCSLLGNWQYSDNATIFVR